MNEIQPDIRYLASIVETSNDAIVSKTVDFTILTWNAGAERLYGYSAEEMIGQPISRLFPPEKTSEEEHLRQKLINGEMIEHYETERITKDGRRIYVSVTISPMFDSQGIVIGASSVARDITERKQSELERRLLASIVDSSDDAIIGKSIEGIITSWNTGVEKLYGYTAKEAIGQSIALIIPPERVDDFEQIMGRIGNGEKVEHYETVRQRKDSTQLDVSLTVPQSLTVTVAS